jgi:4a-hydroxytetrahydrobiopterin dehydratase
MVGVKGRCPLAKLNTRVLSTRVVPRLLTDSEIRLRLEALDGWRHKGKFIVKTFHFDEFMDGISFIDRVAVVAEKEEHHPDIGVRYTDVTLSIQTHSEGGVTEWDVELAEAVEKMMHQAKRSA